jgi:DNA-binding transcriptional MocR family regulator
LALDDEGLRPDALDAACRARPIRLLYTLPTLHNPTTLTMSAERRREVAAVARRHEIAVVEDDVYGFLVDPPMPPLSAMIPERGFFIGSTSKTFAPGLRIGYVHTPPGEVERIVAVLRASINMASPIMAAIASAWIRDGLGDRLAAEKRALAAERQRVALALLGNGASGARLSTHPASLHCWLNLPAHWRAEAFTAAARQRGVGVTPAAAFALGPAATIPEAIRFCLGTVPGTTQLDRPLRILAELLPAASEPYLSVI